MGKVYVTGRGTYLDVGGGEKGGRKKKKKRKKR